MTLRTALESVDSQCEAQATKNTKTGAGIEFKMICRDQSLMILHWPSQSVKNTVKYSQYMFSAGSEHEFTEIYNLLLFSF